MNAIGGLAGLGLGLVGVGVSSTRRSRGPRKADTRSLIHGDGTGAVRDQPQRPHLAASLSDRNGDGIRVDIQAQGGESRPCQRDGRSGAGSSRCSCEVAAPTLEPTKAGDRVKVIAAMRRNWRALPRALGGESPIDLPPACWSSSCVASEKKASALAKSDPLLLTKSDPHSEHDLGAEPTLSLASRQGASWRAPICDGRQMRSIWRIAAHAVAAGGPVKGHRR